MNSGTARAVRLVAHAAFALGLGLAVSCPAMAESQGVFDTQLDAIPDVGGKDQYGFRNGSVVVAPIPFSDPTIGSGLMLGAGYLFTLDEGSNPSSIGIGALRSDNGSQAVGFSVNLAFDNNRWLFKSLFAKADVHYDLYTPAGVMPINQDGILARMSLAYGVTSDLSFGAALRYINTTITPEIPNLPPIPPPFNKFLNVEIASIGFIADWDRRDDTIYPKSGGYLHFAAFHNVAVSGLVQDYDKAYVTYRHYMQLGQSSVLAAQGATCAASSETPFFDLCGLGLLDGFRGFSSTQFLSQRSASLQIEYRHQFTKRLGMVVFGGAGQVGSTYGDLGRAGTHSAVGLGARYRVSKKFPLDFSVDASHNNLGDDLLYIYVGQRF